jgi:hypothetical protein
VIRRSKEEELEIVVGKKPTLNQCGRVRHKRAHMQIRAPKEAWQTHSAMHAPGCFFRDGVSAASSCCSWEYTRSRSAEDSKARKMLRFSPKVISIPVYSSVCVHV